MDIGLCTSAAAHIDLLAASTVDYIEENVQSFLAPRDGDAAGWRNRLEAARASGKPIRSANCFLPSDLPCIGPVVDRTAITAWASTAFKRASQAGIATIVFGSGASRQIPEGFDRAQARDQFVGLLRILGPMATAQGVTLVVEPLNSSECNFINSLAAGADVVRAANVTGVRLLADIYHMLRDNEGPEAIAPVADLLAHAHIAECAKRTAPGVAGDDFLPYLRTLLAGGYRGAMSLECSWSDLTCELPRAVVELRRQVTAASSQVAAASSQVAVAR